MHQKIFIKDFSPSCMLKKYVLLRFLQQNDTYSPTTADKMCVSDHFEVLPPANQIQMIIVIAVMFTLENHA